jgi:hypothetical protein
MSSSLLQVFAPGSQGHVVLPATTTKNGFKGIFQPFELGSETSLIRSAVINYRPGNFLKKFLMIQSNERIITPFTAA